MCRCGMQRIFAQQDKFKLEGYTMTCVMIKLAIHHDHANQTSDLEVYLSLSSTSIAVQRIFGKVLQDNREKAERN